MPEALLLVDEQGLIQMTNERAANIFGYTAAEFQGMPLENLLPIRYRKAHSKSREHFASAPSNREMGAGRELFALHNQGYEFPVEVALSPLVDKGKKMVLAVVSDITVRREAEDELRHGRRQDRGAVHWSKVRRRSGRRATIGTSASRGAGTGIRIARSRARNQASMGEPPSQEPSGLAPKAGLAREPRSPARPRHACPC